MSQLIFCSFLFLSVFFLFIFFLSMFLIKPKFTFYKLLFISIVYARTQLILPKSYMHQGELFWPTYGLKPAFHQFVLIGLLEQ